jgi:hypothetical protein
MSGRSIGLAVAMFAGVRVTGQLTYIPAHINAQGKRINAKCTIPVAKNSHKGTRQDGTSGRTDYFSVTCWGKLADIMARSCPPGKALDLVCEPRSYMGKLFNQDGSLRLDAAGQPIEIPKMSFNVVMSPVFGEESAKQIEREIGEGLRPRNWNVQGHPDFQLWTNMLQQRQAYSWDGQSKNFLWARVVVPQGVQLDFTQNTNAQHPANAAPAAGTTVPSVAPMQTMVQHAVNTAPAAVPVNNVAPANNGGGFQPVSQPAQQYTAAPTAPVAPATQSGGFAVI